MADNQSLGGDLLAWAAGMAANWPHLFSGLIARYMEANSLSEQALCERLHCSRDTLNHLRLCGRPDPDPSAFAIDIQRVADKFGLDVGMLASIVREADSIEAFSKAGQTGQNLSPFSSTPDMLKAARDRDTAEESEIRGQKSDTTDERSVDENPEVEN